MVEIGRDQIHELDYIELMDILQQAFAGELNVPQRHHHEYPNPGHSEGTLLLMPAWDEKYVGVKLITISPDNTRYDLPSIQGSYTLFDIRTGISLASLDAKALTTKRTAATSAMAARFLGSHKTEVLLMVGTGALAPELVRAHNAQKPFRQTLIWGRDPEKGKKLADELSEEFSIRSIRNLDDGVEQADLISVATLSTKPLVRGALLKPGAHLDLVGAYRGDMREADDAALLRSSIFVDTIEGATGESGELRIPITAGTITESDIVAALPDLCSGRHSGRSSEEEITVFKSSGHAIEDLKAARLLYEKEH